MKKLYTEQPLNYEQLKPREETVNFLLNYSKALKIIPIGALNFETFIN
ncbi:MAG: hypothetical protein O3C41_03425 [Bacteroidetes bacterium]|nr:hypothetical protein [Bacteroidota bacterium]MDA1176114.1 hypothetical protein [Bacteroidota bacterium]